MNKVQIFVCKRCGHDWASRMGKPMICPKCKTPYWDKDRLQKSDTHMDTPK